jgi:uncharacterized protein (TIGR04255 family)
VAIDGDHFLNSGNAIFGLYGTFGRGKVDSSQELVEMNYRPSDFKVSLMASMPRTYKSPPVVEAAAEFRFGGTSPWDWTIPGLVYERVRDRYPKKREEKLFQVSVPFDRDRMPLREDLGISKIQFLREDETALIQVGPNLLSVNQLKPYPSWNDFKKVITDALKVYCNIAKPSGLERVGLRYLNRIEVPAPTFPLRDYFNTRPEIPETLPFDSYTSVLIHVDLSYPDGLGALRLNFGSAPTDDKRGSSFMLDLDFFNGGESRPSLDNVSSWLERAHECIETAFERSFTDRTHKEIFGEVTP